MEKRVAVIGVGSAGLATLRYLADCPTVSDIVGFERYGEVGGMWVYTDKTGTDVDGLPVHSACYKDLRTNIPKIAMAFPDFPYTGPEPSFWMHDEFKDYLQAYAEQFKLHQYIKFKTLVTNVDPVTPGNRDTRWSITSCTPGKPETSTTEEFDAVVVCNGHTWCPYEPAITGREKFGGKILHVRDLRTSDPFKNKTVVVVGSGPSAMDIVLVLAPVAKKIITSQASDAVVFTLPENGFRKPLLDHLTETSAVFDNGEEERVDAIILCTGYRYRFPFLSKDCRIVVEDNERRVTPLYKHIMSSIYPSLLFVGVIDYGCNVTYFDLQARFVAKVVDGAVKLPEKAEMDQDTEKEFKVRITETGAPSHTFHKLAFYGGEYCDSLSALANTPTMPMYQRRLFEYLMKDAMLTETLTYKDHDYVMSGDTFKIQDHGGN